MTNCASLTQCNRNPKTAIKRAKFSGAEDAQIRALVASFGTDAWEQIAEAMGNQRTKRQLRERWQNYLSPVLEPAYTELEDQALVSLSAMIGPQWARIATAIGNKSAISARNRYRSLQSLKAHGLKPDYQPANSPVVVSQVQPIEEQQPGFAGFELPSGSDGFSDPWDREFELIVAL
jgi:hypothetical protein